MYLSKLEITGFKSFANKTVFTFAPGITAVVGPNGCGKTNVVDAIRWALGEQKTTVLRSEQMENVIFNGAGSRKPQSMAEVSLMLENTKMLLPVEYTEVVVTRRLYRDGESSYLLNKTQCRLKDIIDLFLDTGMGANSYSVIELKMVEAILSGKAEERRRLVEEAAGINKYKSRRKEAVRKLSYVQNDLVRVRDIVIEVEKQVRSLQRQSAKTARYNKLHLELLGFEKELIAHNYIFFNKNLTNFTDELDKLEQTKKSKEIELAENEKLVESLELKEMELNEQLTRAIDDEQALKDQISTLNENYAVTNEKINSGEIRNNRIENEISELKTAIENLSNQTASTESKIKLMEEDLAAKEQNLTKLIEIQNAAFEMVAMRRNELTIKNEQIINIRNRMDSLRSNRERNESRNKFLREKIEENHAEIGKNTSGIKQLETQIQENEERIAGLREDYKKREIELVNWKKKREELNESIEGLKQKLVEKRVIIARKNSEQEFLSNLAVDDNAANTIIKHKQWKAEKRNFLIELINSDEDYKPAIEAALGIYSNVILVDSYNEVQEALGILNQENLGKAGFICRDRIPSVEFISKSDDGSEGIIGHISELKGIDDDIRNILRILLEDVVLARDLASAEKYVNSHQGSRAVTLRGEVVDFSGYFRGGSLSAKEGINVGKTKKLKKLDIELKNLMEELKVDETELSRLNKELANYNLERLQGEIKKMETDMFYIEKAGSQLSYNLQTLEHNIENILLNNLNFEHELNEVGTESNESNTILEQLEPEIEQKKREMIEINKLLREAEIDYGQKSESVKNVELEITRIKTEHANDLREAKRLQNEIEAKNYKIVSSKEEIAKIMEAIQELKSSTGELDADLKLKAEKADEAHSKREYLQHQKKELEDQIVTREAEVKITRKKFDEVKEDIHKTELRISEIKSKLERVAEDNDKLENEKIDLNTAAVIEGFNAEETKAAIVELKNKLTALGMVNFMALDEYESEKEREEFYHKQVKDLTDAEKTLKDTITEINETAEQLFVKTFEEIRVNFRKLFQSLFSEEGEADLKLVDDNVLECDVEIIAKPPGKKPHSIDLLSGGEKTLTSIAFLFAIYLVKPSPFCILDEVDAPLDDANIDKFIGMLREFSRNTQFLVVTHNKRTMEAADTMYGITQQEEGVSKIVSVRMND